MNDNGTMTVSHSLFHDNRAVGGFGGGFPGGFGAGGAIANVALVRQLDPLRQSQHADEQPGRRRGRRHRRQPQIGRGGGIANFVAGAATPGP